MKTLFRLWFIGTLSLLVSSCATVQKPMVSVPESRRNVSHTVAPGETLWRIGKMYDVPVAAIMAANQLNEATSIRYGQKLLVPNATRVKPVVTLYPSRKWTHIIIHHSGTEEGNSLAFHKHHLEKGWDKGVGYHFVIDNGQSGKQDGQIETTPRWIKQEDGAHCKAADMNTRAIGICLVGDFDQDTVSPRQMESLVYLINRLKNYYRIPENRIMGHNDVEGASTHCPGKNFPWQRFKSGFSRK